MMRIDILSVCTILCPLQPQPQIDPLGVEEVCKYDYS